MNDNQELYYIALFESGFEIQIKLLLLNHFTYFLSQVFRAFIEGKTITNLLTLFVENISVSLFAI